MEQLRALIKQQNREIEELSSELQRKDITPARILRLLRIVQRNAELCERIITILEKDRLEHTK